MNLEINHDKLAETISEIVKEAIKKPYYEKTSVTIGRFKSFELQLTVTRDEDDFIDFDGNVCVEGK